MERQIIAAFDDEGVFVYQSFNQLIADEALQNGTFGQHFQLNRMTWIKPSFGWMLFRSHYATKRDQERILKIKIRRNGFEHIISKGIPTSFDPTLFESREAWSHALQASDVRYQWDPDRDLYLRRMPRRAIQIGIRGEIVRAYINEWILTIEDVTGLAHSIKAACGQNLANLPTTPEERNYPAGDALLGKAVGFSD